MSTCTPSYKKPSPPPPYGETLTSEPHSLSGSVTARRIHALANDVFSGAVPSAIEEWINERSREELSSLLVRANEIIRDRERELSMTSELSKNLYHSNITLEKKHKALLARLPTASSMTPRSTTPSSSVAPTPEHQPSPLPHHKAYHTRRISVSPSDLALLADENAELLWKLENLEVESAQANLAGRRRLGKLEKEIDVLRDELDQYRTRSDALQLQVERGDEEAKRRKQEWNARVRAHRSANSGSSWAFSEAEGNVRDFAPSSNGGGGRPAPLFAIAKPALPTAPDTASLAPSHDGSDASNLEAFAFPTQPSRSTSPVPHAGESALVAQLVSKVRELEFTNEQILETQRDTATKLRDAHIEAEGFQRLYAFLDEQANVELEVVEDGECDARPVQDSDGTMRFQSLRRSINGDLRKLPVSSFGKGQGPDIGDTTHSSGPMKSVPLKARKTVVGLFDTPTQQTRDGAEPSTPINDPSSSPTLSLLDLSAGSPFSSQQASHAHTLGSELGSDYGGDYAENHHLRSSSLYDVFLSGPSAPSRPTTPTPTTPLDNSQLSCNPLSDEPQSPKQCQDLEKTPQRTARKTDHQHRLSDTIRARTHYWVDRRFHYTTPMRRRPSRLGPESGNGPAENQITASKPAVAQVAVQTMTDAEEGSLALVRADATDELQGTSGVAVAPLEPKRSRAMKMVIELWLWAQFMIVILVFLWAVTRRGPRSVLRSGERALSRS